MPEPKATGFHYKYLEVGSAVGLRLEAFAGARGGGRTWSRRGIRPWVTGDGAWWRLEEGRAASAVAALGWPCRMPATP